MLAPLKLPHLPLQGPPRKLRELCMAKGELCRELNI